jgi:hypothetical protein
MNMRDALDKQYYLQLKHINTAYHNTTPIQILQHLDTRWCPLDIRARKLLKGDFFADWDSTVMHLTAFGMKLEKEQVRIDRLGFVISNKDKLQFYMEQIYASNCFDKKEKVHWENKPINIKDDYNEANLYFEGLVRDFEIYTQNSGGNSGKRGYKSANQMADFGDEIRKYIQEIASASVASNKKMAEWAANVNEESKTKNAQHKAMTVQIQALTNTVAMLSNAILASVNRAAAAAAAAAVASAAVATTLAEVARLRSNTRVTREHTAQHMAIILLAPITPAQHACINEDATTTPQQPTTVLLAATSGWDIPRSSPPSMTI